MGDFKMSKHEGFRFWENLEKKSGTQELPNRNLNRDQEIEKRNKPSSQGPGEEGQRKKEEGAASLPKSDGVRPADLARLEKVVSKLELEQGARPRGIAGSNQGCSEDELLQRLALAATRIERVVG